jgi:hypothetical protein
MTVMLLPPTKKWPWLIHWTWVTAVILGIVVAVADGIIRR